MYSKKIGEGEIRTHGTGINPYAGLANRCFQPLSHLSNAVTTKFDYQKLLTSSFQRL